MRYKRSVPFEITSMDSLGQGVSKLSDKVTFIPKTTVGDKGEADVMAEKKGVVFARIQSFTELSKERIKPECIHFDACPSCHYQHVPYEKELQYKKENFQKLFRKLPLPEVEIISAPDRFFYRNRIQLHYSLKSKLIGMRDSQTFAITPIPKCIIGEPEVLKEIQRLYENNNWLKEAPSSQPEGHVEIYWINNELKVSWNKSYADGGFTQVYARMNQKLKSVMLDSWKIPAASDLLDLFGGNGNLSNGFNYSRRLCVDIYKNIPGEEFLNQDLYDDKALKKVLSEIKNRKLDIKHLLLDPPRSGLKNLNEWVEALRPQSIAYVSCDPHTLARDLMAIQGYEFKRSFLIDFFPSTFHFESFIILERKS